MQRMYILSYKLSFKVDRDKFVQELSANNQISYWQYCFPNSIFLKSNLSAKELSEIFMKKYGNLTHYISEVSLENRWGILPEGHWEELSSHKK
jgi:hypothetical protein